MFGYLGEALKILRKHVEAEAAFRKAIDLKPDFSGAYGGLCNELYHQGRYEEAEKACRKTIALYPEWAGVHFILAFSLVVQGKPGEAEAAARKAIKLFKFYEKNDYDKGYFILGRSLDDQGKLAEAEAAYRKAIDINRYLFHAYLELGSLLQKQGRFKESLAIFRRCHELGSKQPNWPFPSPRWIRNTERLIELEKRLPAILQGETSPANPSEAVSFAQMCQQPYKKRYAASVRLYIDAFAADPKLVADLKEQHRYNAACSAALIAAGQGEDARSVPDKERIRLRRLALTWLHDDLTAYAKLTEQNNPDAHKTIQQSLTHWRRDPDLASVRDSTALDRLADNERAAWQSLWRDVDELAKRVAKTNEPKAAQKKPNRN